MEAQKIAVILLTDLVSGKNNHVLGIVPLNKGNILVIGIVSRIKFNTIQFQGYRKRTGG